MVRPKRSRTITGVPDYNMFVPDGIPQRGYIELALDEFEVIRLIISNLILMPSVLKK